VTSVKRVREETPARMAKPELKVLRVPREARDPGARLGLWVHLVKRERSELPVSPATRAALERREKKDRREPTVLPDPRVKEDATGCRAPWVPPAPEV